MKFTGPEIATIRAVLSKAGETELAAKVDAAAKAKDTVLEGGDFMIEMLLNNLAIYDVPGHPNRTIVEQAIQPAQQAIDLCNANRNVFEQLAKYWQQIGPAAKIVVDAVAAKQQGG